MAIDWSRHHRIVRAARVLAGGGVVAYPTEAVWGLGADPANPDAIARLLALKDRPRHKGLIMIAAGMDQIEPWLAPLTNAERQRLDDTWPGPVTWLIPNRGIASHWVTGDFATLALRVTDHPVAAGLCRAFGGPLISTSANPAGRPPARNSLTLRRYFGARLDDIVPGPLGGRTRPSQIRDLTSGQLHRPG